MKRLNDEKLVYICDRFFLGGPHTIRGFEHRGIGPHSDNQALGAQVFNLNTHSKFVDVTCRKIVLDSGLLGCSSSCIHTITFPAR